MADNVIGCGTNFTFEELLAASIGVDADGHAYIRQIATTDVCESRLFDCNIPFDRDALLSLFALDDCGAVAMRVAAAPGGAAPVGGASFGMFYGLTEGTGMSGTDYAGTIAVGAKMPFPQDGPASGIVRVDADDFTLPTIGTYEITFRVHTTEPGQLQATLDGTVLEESTAVNMNPTSGGHPIIGNFFVTTTLPNQVLAIINPAGNSTALTITPANGSNTHANSQSLTIKLIG